MNAMEPGGNPDRANGQSLGWEHELDELLLSLRVERERIAPPAVAPAAEQSAEAIANPGESADWSSHIAMLYQAKYGVSMLYPTVQEVRSVDEQGRERVGRKTNMMLVGYILPIDHTPSGVVALYKDGSHDYLPAPPDPDGEQAFRARFIPGGAPFVLRPESVLDVPRQLFLDQAAYHHDGLRRYDNHNHGDEASAFLAEAVRAAPRMAEERRLAKVRNVGQGTLALESIHPPEEPKQH